MKEAEPQEAIDRLEEEVSRRPTSRAWLALARAFGLASYRADCARALAEAVEMALVDSESEDRRESGVRRPVRSARQADLDVDSCRCLLVACEEPAEQAGWRRLARALEATAPTPQATEMILVGLMTVEVGSANAGLARAIARVATCVGDNDTAVRAWLRAVWVDPDDARNWVELREAARRGAGLRWSDSTMRVADELLGIRCAPNLIELRTEIVAEIAVALGNVTAAARLWARALPAASLDAWVRLAGAVRVQPELWPRLAEAVRAQAQASDAETMVGVALVTAVSDGEEAATALLAEGLGRLDAVSAEEIQAFLEELRHVAEERAPSILPLVESSLHLLARDTRHPGLLTVLASEALAGHRSRSAVRLLLRALEVPGPHTTSKEFRLLARRVVRRVTRLRGAKATYDVHAKIESRSPSLGRWLRENL